MTREEAIEWLIDAKEEFVEKLGTNTEAYDMAIEALEQLEQKKGKWINPSRNPEYVNKEFFSDCSVCGFTTMDEQKECPICGAKMEGEE